MEENIKFVEICVYMLLTGRFNTFNSLFITTIIIIYCWRSKIIRQALMELLGNN